MAAGSYVVQVWAKEPSFPGEYETLLTTGTQTPITLTATATGGSAPLEYQFHYYDATEGVWYLLQAYSPARTLGWTPPRTGYGGWLLQVTARAQGTSTPAFSAQTGWFSALP